MNYGEMLFSFNGMTPKMFSRKEIDLGEWTEMLLKFDKEFVKHFEWILKEITLDYYFKKPDLLSNEFFSDYFEYCEKIKRKGLS